MVEHLVNTVCVVLKVTRPTARSAPFHWLLRKVSRWISSSGRMSLECKRPGNRFGRTRVPSWSPQQQTTGQRAADRPAGPQSLPARTVRREGRRLLGTSEAVVEVKTQLLKSSLDL